MSKLEEKFKEVEERVKAAELGGGLERIDKQHKAGKKTARERINDLLDPDTFVETDRMAVHKCIDFDMDKKKSASGTGNDMGAFIKIDLNPSKRRTKFNNVLIPWNNVIKVIVLA